MEIEIKQFVEWFRSASPYIRVHRGKTIVIQMDDDTVTSAAFTDLVHDLALLNSLEIRLVIVFGARTSIERGLADKDIALEYHRGVRVTTARAMDCIRDVVGGLRIKIEAALSMGLGNTPMKNADIRVSSGNFIIAKPIGIVDGIDFQFTGEVRTIDIRTIAAKLDQREMVLVAPIGYSPTGECFNLNAENLAARVAGDLAADKLIYLMASGGLTDRHGEFIRQMTQAEAEALVNDTQEASDYHHYLKSAVAACKRGVHRVHLINRDQDGAIIQELFTRDGAGTMITTIPYDVIRGASVEDIPGLLMLIEPLEKSGVLVQRSREKLELEIGFFTVMERDGVIIGCGAQYLLDDTGDAELACLAVHRDYHGHGRGEMLLHIIEDSARTQSVKRLFVLTTHAEHWFLEQGFVNTAIEDLPVERKRLYNFQRNSKVLVKTL